MTKVTKRQNAKGLKTQRCSSVACSHQTLQNSSSDWFKCWSQVCCEPRLFIPKHLHWLVHYRYRSTLWGRLQTAIIPVFAGVVAIPVPVLQSNPEVYPSDGGLCHVSNLLCLATEFFFPSRVTESACATVNSTRHSHNTLQCPATNTVIFAKTRYLSEINQICMQPIVFFYFSSCQLL